MFSQLSLLFCFSFFSFFLSLFFEFNVSFGIKMVMQYNNVNGSNVS